MRSLDEVMRLDPGVPAETPYGSGQSLFPFEADDPDRCLDRAFAWPTTCANSVFGVARALPDAGGNAVATDDCLELIVSDSLSLRLSNGANAMNLER